MFAIQYTPDGPVPVLVGKNKTTTPMVVPTVKLKELPRGFGRLHHEALYVLRDYVEHVKASGRTVPLTRREYLGSGGSIGCGHA